MPEGHLEVELLRAYNLKDVEAFGKSDPYAVLTCGSAKFESKVLQDAGGNPVWNETFLMETKADNAPELLIALFDKEKKGKDEPMGTIRVPLAAAYSQKQAVAPTKYKVQLKNGKFHGEVELRMKFFPKLSRKGTLEVKLVEGHDLLSADVASKSDPYAVIKCDTQQHKSHVMKNAGSNPVWNESFVFEINGNANELHVSLFDKDTFSKDDPLGNATIPLQRVFITGQVAPTPYKVVGKAGQPQGDIVVGLTFNSKA